MGFGTGLNALLTAIRSQQLGRALQYTALERYPLASEVYRQLNYPRQLDATRLYEAIMGAVWEHPVGIHPFFQLLKREVDLTTYACRDHFDIIYFDAFAPEEQPEMWEAAICRKMFELLNQGGVLVSYCSKSVVRKALVHAGFEVTKLPGPPGKREVIRATKP